MFKMRACLATTLAVAVLCVDAVSAITFTIEGGKQKCIQEDVQKDVLVVGTYNVHFQVNNGQNEFQVDLEITDGKTNRLYQKIHAQDGKFAFTSDDYDTFNICFNQKPINGEDMHLQPAPKSEITLDVKLGVEAKSYADIQKAEHLSNMELELRRLEDLAESIVNDFAQMKLREETHRDTNESTNERMLHFSILSMICLLALAVWQVMYLKRYFKQKKLI